MKRYVLLFIALFVSIFPAKVFALDNVLEKPIVYNSNIEQTKVIFKDKNSSLLINALGSNLAPTRRIACDDDIKKTINKYWKYVTLLAPFGLIVLVTIDFLKAIMSSNTEQIKKSSTDALKRAIAMLLLFLAPIIVKIVFTWFGMEKVLCF